jgi:hypothetical protein
LIKLGPYLLGRDFNKDAGIKGMDETKRSFDVGSFPDFAWSGYAAWPAPRSISVRKRRIDTLSSSPIT